MKPNELEALRMLGQATRGQFRCWDLMGPALASTRVAILCKLRGVAKLPKAAAGVTVLEREFYALREGDPACHSEEEDRFSKWAARVTAS